MSALRSVRSNSKVFYSRTQLTSRHLTTMSQYKSSWPSNLENDPAYVSFFENFYKISDTADAHEEYANQFTSDATLIMASKKVQGKDDILGMRKAMWEKISARSHVPEQIFPFTPASSNGQDVMLHGTVTYDFKAGGKGGLPWAAKAKLVKDGGRVKMSFYQVYLDSAAQKPS
ncbi:hypothetical protein KVT40_004333 [Elsinoe batatas]|uniref:SnoaL-like domain-containing protein n=1 Tax=Elsinoe batatas TaxID=2601811 RepID=A0A8K0L3Y0_9PEZI|nr:hypothetical protein KVT40_004333 [Elsinoe batatas]